MILFRKILLLLVLSLAVLACEDTIDNNNEDAVEGSGPIITQTIPLSAIHGFDASGSFEVVIAQGDTQNITVEGQANLIDILSTRVAGGIWDLRFTENVRNARDFTVYITVPNIDEINLSGSSAIRSEGTLILDALSITGSGSATINLAGTVDTQTIRISGSGTVRNFDFVSRVTTVTVSGSGDIEVTATEALDATVSGSGDIRYRGNPASVGTRISGSGSVSKD